MCEVISQDPRLDASAFFSTWLCKSEMDLSSYHPDPLLQALRTSYFFWFGVAMSDEKINTLIHDSGVVRPSHRNALIEDLWCHFRLVCTAINAVYVPDLAAIIGEYCELAHYLQGQIPRLCCVVYCVCCF